MSNGIVVDNEEAGVRYAVSGHNHNIKTEKFVRELKAGETVRDYRPKRLPVQGEEDPNTGDPDEGGEGDSEDENTLEGL